MAQRVTRAQAKRARLEAEQSAAILASCPRELWTLVLSNLSARQIAQAGLVCREWAGIQPAALQLACELRWPEWCSAARAPHSANWKRLHELFEQRERDHGAVGSLAGFGRTQKVVSPRHRAILAEWLIEVRPSASQLDQSTKQLLYSLFGGPRRPIRLLQATVGCRPNCSLQASRAPRLTHRLAAGRRGLVPGVHNRVQGRRLPGPLPQQRQRGGPAQVRTAPGCLPLHR